MKKEELKLQGYKGESIDLPFMIQRAGKPTTLVVG